MTIDNSLGSAMPDLMPFLVGGTVTAVTLVFHAAALGATSLVIHHVLRMVHNRRPFTRITVALTVAGSLLTAAHFMEVALWAVVYRVFAVTAQPDAWIYFAFVNYTTLGYGDVLAKPEWRLLGPITATDGIMLFGLTTALLFHVINVADSGRPLITRPPP